MPRISSSPVSETEFAPFFENDGNGLPLLTPPGVESVLRSGEYGKIGYAFGIEDRQGAVLTSRHRASAENGVEDGQIGPPSETVMGRFDDEGRLCEVEELGNGMGRCLFEEQCINLSEAPANGHLYIMRLAPVIFVDCNMTQNGARPIKNTFALALTLSADDEMAEFISDNASGSDDETHPGQFRSVEDLERSLEAGEPVRAAFDVWLGQHRTFSAPTGASEQRALTLPAEIKIKSELENDGWKDLRVANIGDMALAGANI